MSDTISKALQVPGANLYYKVLGSGPILLMIHGGNGNADIFNGIVHHLAEQYTVVTYDRRGHSRSKLDDPDENYLVETHSDDAHRLLAALTSEPAYVFGSSSGAVIGLDLTARHSEQVRMLVPHEPPLFQVLPEAEQAQARQVLGILGEDFRDKGPIPAFMKFVSSIGMSLGEQTHQLSAEQLVWISVNLEYFLVHEAPGIRRYELELSALKNAQTRILPAGGRISQDFFPYHCSRALADYLGTEIVEFPGNHAGYVMQPREFAERMCEILRD